MLHGKQIQNESIDKDKLSLVDPVNPNDPATKDWVEKNGSIEKFSDVNKKMLANEVLEDDLLGCNTPIEKQPIVNSGVDVYVNGIKIDTGLVDPVSEMFNTSTTTNNSVALTSNFNTTLFKDEENNVLYVGTDSNGVWRYNIETGDALLYNNSNSTLPNDTITLINKINEKLFIGTENNGLWYKNLDTNVEKIFNDTNGTSFGTNLPSNSINDLDYDSTNNILYVATNGGVWEYNFTTDNGFTYNDVGGASFGDQLVNNMVKNVRKDITNNLLFATYTSGMWELDITTETGRLFDTTSGVTSGVNIPSDVNDMDMDKNLNILYLSTDTAIWVYDINTGEGSLIDVNITMIDDSLPSGVVKYIKIDSLNNTVYTTIQDGTTYYIHEFDQRTNIGKTFTSNDFTGTVVNSIFKDGSNGIIYSTTNSGTWSYTKKSGKSGYFKSANGILRDYGKEQQGDLFYFKPSLSGYELEADDYVDFVYLVR